MKNKTVFKGRLINVSIKKVRLPNGYLATLETIKHPGAALIVPFMSKDKVILLKQYRPVIDSYIYELPAGTLDKNESPASCARREIIEETGYSAKKITYLGRIFPVPGYSTECISIYKAEGLRKEDHEPEEDEVITSGVFTRAAIRKLFKSGKIVDAKTISAFAMCGWI
ncbi:MAG: NUDIX hydrolase [Candidatus Omnitrophota bacterium]